MAEGNFRRVQNRGLLAHVLPMGVFLLLLAAGEGMKALPGGFAIPHPEFWVFPVQTILCGAILVFFWRRYPWRRPEQLLFTLTAAVSVFVLWIAPQQFFGMTARSDGFNPDLLGSPAFRAVELIFRFLRLVVVVPLVEEIFWRSFLLRFLVTEDFESIPFGRLRWFPFLAVAIAFCFSHSRPDWPAAFVTGVIYNLVAWRSKSLTSCVIAHAVTNLLLGCWIMQTRQWGFW